MLLRRVPRAWRGVWPSAFTRAVSQSALDSALHQLLDESAEPSRAPQATAEQVRAVDLAVRGFSVFLRLPTGAGKSLAFQAPALIAPSSATTIVVSPLVALIQVSACACVSTHCRP